jgi:hypothetical protein
MIGRQRSKAGAISSKSVPKANAANQIQPRMGHPHPLRYRYSSIAMVEHGGSVNQFCMKDMLANTLLAEAERKDTAFRSDFNAEQRRGFPPFTFFGWKEHEAKINDIVLSIEDRQISLEEGHVLVKSFIEQYYGCP